jgi:hypothetical protein
MVLVFLIVFTCICCQQETTDKTKSGSTAVKTGTDTASAGRDDPGSGIVLNDDTVPSKAVFDELLHDFGEVEQGEELHYAFSVRNEGEGPLRILTVKPS